MKRIRILLYVTPKFKWKYKINWLISLWTRSKYSHAEAWTPDEFGNFFDLPVDTGTCWTSTTRGEANGTVKRDASKVLKHPKNWVYFEIEIENETSYAAGIAYMEYEVKNNKGYAMRDLWKFVIGGFHKPDNSRNICSEFVANFLYYAGVFDKGGIVTPKWVFKKLKKLGYKATELLSNT